VEPDSQDLRGVSADHLGGGPAGYAPRAFIPERDAPFEVRHDDGVVGLVEEVRLLAYALLGRVALEALPPVAQGAVDRGDQALHPVLDEVILRAGLEGLDCALLADRPGEEDEGGPGNLLLDDLEGIQPGEGAEGEIGEHQVVGIPLDERRKLLAVRDQVDLAARPLLGEQQANKLRVVGIVLDVQDPHGWIGRRPKGGKGVLLFGWEGGFGALTRDGSSGEAR
jgi:hypothetical protein